MEWYPIYTNSKAEKAARIALEKKGIEVYLPIQKQLRQWSDRKKWVEMPFLPSYIFVRIEPHQFADVLMCKGISRFIYFAGKIATIPERQISQLKLLLANASELEVSDVEFQEGQHVIVKAGPLQGLRGELISWHSTRKMLIKIDYISQSILVQISQVFLDPIESKTDMDCKL